MPCNPDGVSIKSYTGPMRVFHTFIEGYINWEHTGLVVDHVWKPG